VYVITVVTGRFVIAVDESGRTHRQSLAAPTTLKKGEAISLAVWRALRTPADEARPAA
jgi:hypothetical protein